MRAHLDHDRRVGERGDRVRVVVVHCVAEAPDRILSAHGERRSLTASSSPSPRSPHRAQARRQGPLRHGRADDDLRLDRLRRPRARADAEAVTRLEAAGYANVGKTNLHEFAYGITSVNPHYGTVPNPSYPGRMAGGSSGGSAAALAAGLADAALGTDSGGSIRIPAACCGVVGFKPTFGLVSLEGVLPACAELRPRRPDGALGRRVHGDDARPRRRLRADRRSSRSRRSRSASPGSSRPILLVRARVREASELFPRRPRDRLPARGGDRPRLHARGRGRAPRSLRRVRRLLRRQRAHEGRALPHRDRRRLRTRASELARISASGPSARSSGSTSS